MNEKLAFIITSDKYAGYISGLIEAAAEKDYAVSVFIMDKGVFLTEDKDFISLIKRYKHNVDRVSVCEHSCGVNGVISRIDDFNYASQFENAKMVSELEEKDRILLFQDKPPHMFDIKKLKENPDINVYIAYNLFQIRHRNIL